MKKVLARSARNFALLKGVLFVGHLDHVTTSIPSFRCAWSCPLNGRVSLSGGWQTWPNEVTSIVVTVGSKIYRPIGYTLCIYDQPDVYHLLLWETACRHRPVSVIAVDVTGSRDSRRLQYVDQYGWQGWLGLGVIGHIPIFCHVAAYNVGCLDLHWITVLVQCCPSQVQPLFTYKCSAALPWVFSLLF